MLVRIFILPIVLFHVSSHQLSRSAPICHIPYKSVLILCTYHHYSDTISSPLLIILVQIDSS